MNTRIVLHDQVIRCLETVDSVILRCQVTHYHALFEGAVKVALSVPYQRRDEDPQIPHGPRLDFGDILSDSWAAKV